MKKIFILCSFLIILCSGLFSKQYYGEEKNETKEDNQFKVMGYFSALPFNDPIDESIQFEGLTHLIYAFLKPKSDGTLRDIAKPDRLKELVEKSHSHGVKVIISIGGWSYNNVPLKATFESLASTDKGIENFVQEVSSFVDEYNLDGVELDWEYPTLDSAQNYEKLVISLDKELEEKNVTLSAALAGAWSKDSKSSSIESVSLKALECFDWINIMAYDLHEGHHSPYWFAEASIDYWLKRGVEKEKIILGIPLYARPSWKQYRHIVQVNKENAYLDFVKGDKLDSYYNGLNTICEKTRLALIKSGGIMFFDINEDTHDETSAQNAALVVIDEYKNSGLNNIYLIVDNHEIKFNEKDGLGVPYIDNHNRTLVPIRKALEAIGAKLTYDSNTSSVIIEKDENIAKIIINDNILEFNGKIIEMDTIAVIKKDRMYLPIRWIYEVFGYNISWHGTSKTIIVKNTDK